MCCDLAMQLQAAVSELQHGAQHGETSPRLRSQQLQGCQHRLGRSVVSLIEKRQTTLLHAAVASTQHSHLHHFQRLARHTQLIGNSNGQKQIAGVVAPLQLKRETIHIDQQLIPIHGSN